jgi:hypothetical protein
VSENNQPRRAELPGRPARDSICRWERRALREVPFARELQPARIRRVGRESSTGQTKGEQRNPWKARSTSGIPACVFHQAKATVGNRYIVIRKVGVGSEFDDRLKIGNAGLRLVLQKKSSALFQGFCGLMQHAELLCRDHGRVLRDWATENTGKKNWRRKVDKASCAPFLGISRGKQTGGGRWAENPSW